MEMTPAMRELEAAANEFQALQNARDRAVLRLQEAIRAADAERVNRRADIIRLSGVARQTVYDALAERDPGAGKESEGAATA